MRPWPFVALALTVGCSEPLYDATEPGVALTEWKHDGEVADPAELPIQRVTTASGLKLRVEGSRGISDGKRLPTRLLVTLEENPVSAEVSVTCRPPSQLDGDPLDLLTVMCMVAELRGTESWLGSKESQQDVSTLRVKGDGAISLEGCPPSRPSATAAFKLPVIGSSTAMPPAPKNARTSCQASWACRI